MQSLSKLLASCMFAIEIVVLHFIIYEVRRRSGDKVDLISQYFGGHFNQNHGPPSVLLTLPIVIKLDCNF